MIQTIKNGKVTVDGISAMVLAQDNSFFYGSPIFSCKQLKFLKNRFLYYFFFAFFLIELPEGKWNMYINGEKAGTEVIQTIKNGKVTVDVISAMVLPA